MSTSRYGGWPLKPSPVWPGEVSLACPHCGSRDITLSGCYAVRGTAPCGRGRLGDPGGSSWAECNTCKKRGYYTPDTQEQRT